MFMIFILKILMLTAAEISPVALLMALLPVAPNIRANPKSRALKNHSMTSEIK